MKKLYFLLLIFSTLGFSQPILTAIVDGDCTGGSPKVVEIFAQGTVDFSNYNIELQTNANTTWGSSTSLSPLGTRTNEFVYVISNHEPIFNVEFPSATNYMIAGGPTNFNGDDRVRIIDINTTGVIDQFGAEGVDGTGQTWEYTDSYAKRVNGTGPDAGFAESNWTFGGVAFLNNEGDCQGGTIFETLMGGIGTYTAGSDPSLVITSPSNGQVLNPLTTSVDVNLSINNFVVATAGNGDGHIHYTINGGSTIMKFDTTPITVPVSAGNSYTVYVELVDDSHNPITPAVNATVTFEVTTFTVVNNIAEIRADVIANGTGKYYELTGEAIVTFTRPVANRSQKYIQDATAAILIDDDNDIITNTFAIGDGMTGLRGQTSLFNGVLQIIPLEDIAPNAPGFSITPQVVTVADITGDIEAYESELVRINGVTFTDGDGINTFASGTNYDITDANTMAFRTIFSEVDYVVNADLIPSGSTDIVVLVAEFNGTAQVAARSLSDVTLSTTNFNAIDGLVMYPNPVSGNTLSFSSTANGEMFVQIFDILGKEVVKANVINNQVNVSGLNAGVYIVKVTEAGKTATRKLVVK